MTNCTTTHSRPPRLALLYGRVTFLVWDIAPVLAPSSSLAMVARQKMHLSASTVGTSSPPWVRMARAAYTSTLVNLDLFSSKPMSRNGDWRRVWEHLLPHQLTEVREEVFSWLLVVILPPSARLLARPPDLVGLIVLVAQGVHFQAPHLSNRPHFAAVL